jgi:putative PIN family toxin of toxin-antitoxin system
VNRVVIDTNVFVSGTSIANTPPSQVLDLWRNGLFVLVTSPQLMAEVKDVFTRPNIMNFTGLSLVETQAFLQEMKRRSDVTKGEYHIKPLAGNPADTVVLQAAVEGGATHIVTGDKKHLLPLKAYQGIPIVTPRGFLSEFQGMRLRRDS